jgi:predicted RNase H-like HicB family nuclease
VRPNMRYSGPQLLSSWLHGAAPRQPSCQLPRRARAVGPAELAVRRRSAARYNGRGDKAMRYKVAITQSEEGFSVSVPGLPGCWSQGTTEEEAISNIEMAVREYLEVVDELLSGAKVREIEIAV